jgi:Pregnancy-associated plasma protein-A
VHEVGHWLGLFHTYQGGCAFPGDGIFDTPPQAVPSFSCNTALDTCPACNATVQACPDGEGDLLPDPVTNYMNLAPDACVSNFTADQRQVMIAAWYRFRSPPVPTASPAATPSASTGASKVKHVISKGSPTGKQDRLKRGKNSGM